MQKKSNRVANLKLKGVAYCRVAAASQTTPQGSIEEQQKVIFKTAKKLGVTIDKTFVTAGGKSPSTNDSLRAALQYCEANKIGSFWVSSIDRISRSQEVLEQWQFEFKRAGVVIVVMTESIEDLDEKLWLGSEVEKLFQKSLLRQRLKAVQRKWR